MNKNYKIPKPLHLPQRILNLNSVPKPDQDSMMDEGLLLIAKGKVSVLIDACDPEMGQKLGCPKLLYKFKHLDGLSLL